MDSKLPSVNKFSGGYEKYEVIYCQALPSPLEDLLMEKSEAVNGSGQIVNPQYIPDFAVWLIENGMAVKPYIVWFSW